jgi:hypothetical protein
MTQTDAEDPHCVKIEIKVSGSGFGTYAERNAIQQWAGRLATNLSDTGIGEYDGDEFGGGICKLYIYGKNADELFAAISPLLPDLPAPLGGRLIKTYGSPGARTEVVDLPAS